MHHMGSGEARKLLMGPLLVRVSLPLSRKPRRSAATFCWVASREAARTESVWSMSVGTASDTKKGYGLRCITTLATLPEFSK